mgnify:FL=1
MKRKQFIKTCGFVCLGVATSSIILQGCVSSIYFAQSSIEDKRLIIKKTEFNNTEKHKQTQRKFILVKTEQLSFPICIYKHDEENYTALFMQCTHKGCELKPQGDYLIWPCHGSEFTNRGFVQNPPAEDSLRNFIIKTDNENLYIQL